MTRVLPLLLLLVSGMAYAQSPPSTLANSCVERYAAQYRVPAELIAAFIDVESG